jgi:hypothetical protein
MGPKVPCQPAEPPPFYLILAVARKAIAAMLFQLAYTAEAARCALEAAETEQEPEIIIGVDGEAETFDDDGDDWGQAEILDGADDDEEADIYTTDGESEIFDGSDDDGQLGNLPDGEWAETEQEDGEEEMFDDDGDDWGPAEITDGADEDEEAEISDSSGESTHGDAPAVAPHTDGDNETKRRRMGD